MSSGARDAGGSPRAATDRNVLVIVADGPREQIVDTLAAGGLASMHVDCVNSIQETAEARHVSAIVLWVTDTIASIPACITPLTQSFTRGPVVLTCEAIERWELRAALSAGASGVVIRKDLERALVPCVYAAQAGQVCVPRADWRQIEPPALSTREKQILGLVVMGYMNGQIAEQLYLAESTVKSHLSSAFGKLGVRSRNEAVNLILDPERGLGTGILGLGADAAERVTSVVS